MLHSEYLTVSTVCVHPLVVYEEEVVKKQCHLLWDRERIFEHKSHGRLVH